MTSLWPHLRSYNHQFFSKHFLGIHLKLRQVSRSRLIRFQRYFTKREGGATFCPPTARGLRYVKCTYNLPLTLYPFISLIIKMVMLPCFGRIQHFVCALKVNNFWAYCPVAVSVPPSRNTVKWPCSYKQFQAAPCAHLVFIGNYGSFASLILVPTDKVRCSLKLLLINFLS